MRKTTVLLGLLLSGILQAQDAKPPEPIVARTNQPLDLLLTQAELRSIIRSYETRTGEITHGAD